MPILLRDFEARSILDLKKVGVWRYATHPDTDVLCCAYSVDDGPVELWIPGDNIPTAWLEASTDPSWLVVAFNDNFERQIENHMMAPRYSWPVIPIGRHRCLQASALSLALPGSLEKVAIALGLRQLKDNAGHLNMMTMARPRKPSKDEPAGIYWHTDPVRFARLYDYCKQDIETERALHTRIGFISDAEQAVWELDAAINDRGIYIDGDLAAAAITTSQIARQEIDAELSTLTGGAVTTVDQVGRLTQFLNSQGCAVPDIGKETLDTILLTKPGPKGLSSTARRAVELRLDGAHASANIRAMLAWRNLDSRIRGALKYHDASTGRWSSSGVQLQNLKLPVVADLGTAIDDVSKGDIAHLRANYPQPMAVIGDITRAIICASPGHTFFAADFSGVEARVLAWLAGEKRELKQWTRFDVTGDPADEPYFITGRAMGLDRDKGKTATLAFGYMGGVGAYRVLAPSDPVSDDEIKVRQQAWRTAHPATVKFWGDINRSAIRAVQEVRKRFEANDKISFYWDDDHFLRMRLPNGRELAYPFPRLVTDPHGELGVVFKDYQAGKWGDCRGGRGAFRHS